MSEKENNDGKQNFVDFVNEHGGFSGCRLPAMNYEKRVIDQFKSREELMPHLANFMQHSVAKNVNPNLETIIDWLYSPKGILDRDDFVSIERCREMVAAGQMLPNIIVEVLDYASAVEKAAKDVADAMSRVEGFPELDTLKDALSHRFVKKSPPKEDKPKMVEV